MLGQEYLLSSSCHLSACLRWRTESLVEELGMATSVDAGEEARAVLLEQARASLEQGWTIVQDVDKVDQNLRNKLGLDLDEEVEDGVSYISFKTSEPVRVKDVVAKLKPEKVPVHRAYVSSEWVSGLPMVLRCEDPDIALRLFTLKMQPYYRKEGPDRYAVKVELLDIMWDGNLEKNESRERGFYVDVLRIRLIPMWKGDDRSPTSFSPPPRNETITLQRGRQTTLVAGIIGPKPTASVTYGESTSQASSSQSYTTEWERSAIGGSATLKWRLNMMWCPGSGASKSQFIPYKTEKPVRGIWAGGSVPKLPPPYIDGNFYGLDSAAPSAGWSVQASTFTGKKVCWKPEVSMRVSKMKAMIGAQFSESLRRSEHRELDTTKLSDGLLVCLTPAASTGNPISWMVDQLSEADSYTTWIIIALVPAVLAAAVVVWQLHGKV